MNRGVRRLLWREAWGQLRALLRRLRSPRGALAVVAAASALAAMVWLTRWQADLRPEQVGVGSESFRRFGPIGILGMALLGLLSPRGLYFRPAEIDFLFAAPIGARQLVLYNVLARARMPVLSALWLALLPTLRGASWAASALGWLLVMLLLQISAQWLAVLRAWLRARTAPGARRVVTTGVLLCLAAAVASVAAAALRAPAGTVGEAVLATPAVWIATAPTRPIVAALSAGSLTEALPGAAATGCVLLLLVAHMCLLEAGYGEAALERSQRAQSQRRRARRAGALFASEPTLRVRLPRPPRLEGSGPVAWRQGLALARNPRGLLLVLALIGLWCGLAVGAQVVAARAEGTELPLGSIAVGAVALVVLVPLLMSDNLAFDFRRDLDRMDALKALPISSLALAAGQTLAPVLFATGVQLLGIAVIALATGALSALHCLLLALALPPFNWMASSIDNTLFLLLPYRTVAEDPADVGFVGRFMVAMALKLLVLGAVFGGIALVAGAIHRASGSLVLTGVSVALALLSACAPGTVAVAWAFRRFDVSRDVPA